jgi:hypothetical protein
MFFCLELEEKEKWSNLSVYKWRRDEPSLFIPIIDVLVRLLRLLLMRREALPAGSQSVTSLIIARTVLAESSRGTNALNHIGRGVLCADWSAQGCDNDIAAF